MGKLGNYVENLSIGAGGAITSGLDATVEALRNPRATARGIVQGAQAFASDPAGSIRQTAADYGQRLSSGPMGIGSVLGELVPSPGRAGSMAARMSGRAVRREPERPKERTRPAGADTGTYENLYLDQRGRYDAAKQELLAQMAAEGRTPAYGRAGELVDAQGQPLLNYAGKPFAEALRRKGNGNGN